MNDPVCVAIQGSVALVTVDNPPVNALSHRVRLPLAQALASLDADTSVQAIVLTFAGKTFSVGADVREFDRPPVAPLMGDILRAMDAARCILVAAIHGQALGGGLETALVCDYRLATPDARFGLPEINLALMPGGGGTQRLPRVIGVERAIEMIVSGKPVGAREALALGLIDEIAESDLVGAAIALARRCLDTAGARRRLSRKPLPADNFDFDTRRTQAVKATRLEAAGRAVDGVQAATQLDFEGGLAREAELFQLCRGSAEAAALRYLFASEREVARIPDAGTPREITSTAVVGAGTMGVGIATALLDAGYRVTLIETTQQALDRGVSAIGKIYDSLVARGRVIPAARAERVGRLTPTLALDVVADVDLVIESVFEDMAVKQALFRRLGESSASHAVLATNTSALNVNAIADASGRPQGVVGMHFFSPANIMKLVEVVRGAQTDPEVIATAMAVTKRMGKIGVVSGVCDGFIGNRMIAGYLRQANLLLLEGALPQQIDCALREFGMAMGPHAMGDMAGLDIQAAARARRRAEGKIPGDDPSGAIGDRLVAAGRFGLKSGRGMYRYEGSDRTPLPDPYVETLILEESARLKVKRRVFSNSEIIARCILPLVNEGSRIIDEGIAFGAADIDVVYCNGYGFPRWRGGPMWYADSVGLPSILQQIEQFHDRLDARHWQPSPLLSRLVGEGRRFSDLKRVP